MSELAAQFDEGATSGQDPVAITDAYAILVGPLDIQDYDRFTVYVENVGGGAGDDITSVMVQIAPVDDDADLWGNLGEVLPGNLPAAASAFLSFADASAKYLRIRAKCAAAESTTAKIWFSAGGYA